MPRNKWGTLTDGVLYLDPVPPVFKNPNAFQNFVAKLRLDETNRVVTLACILFIVIVISTFFQLKFEQHYNERQQQLFHRAHDTVNVVSPSTTISAQTEGLSGTKIVQIEQKGKQRESIAEPTSDDYRSDGPSPGFREYIIENTDNAGSKTELNKLVKNQALIEEIWNVTHGNLQYDLNVNKPLPDDEASIRSTWTTASDDIRRKRQRTINNNT
eukprot:549018_1